MCIAEKVNGEYDHALAVAHQALALRQKEGIDLTYNQLQLGKLYIAAAKLILR